MNTVSAIGLSGMTAARTALGASAHNIANLGTPGFRRQQSVQSALPDGGVQVSLDTARAPGPAAEADMVGVLSAKHQFLANLAVFKAADQAMGSLLDVAG